MKLRIERDTFADAIAWTSRALPAKAPTPVLSGLLLSADGPDGPMAGGTLHVAAFDYEVSARVGVPADVITGGRALVPGRLLADVAKSLPARPVDLVVDGSRAVVSCGSSKFTLLTMIADDYPTLPTMPAGSGTVDGGVLAGAVAQVGPAASKDAGQAILTAIRVIADTGTLTLLATDKYRMAVTTIPWRPAGDVDVAASIPARALQDLARTLSGGCEVTFGLSDGMAGFEVAGRRSTSLLVDGDYPNLTAILPTDHSGSAVVWVSPLVEAVKRVALVAERNTPVDLAFTAGTVTVAAGRGADAQGVDEVDCALTGTEIVQRYNPQFLLDGLAGVPTPYVRFSFTEPGRPALLTGQAEWEGMDDPAYRYLLMPVRS